MRGPMSLQISAHTSAAGRPSAHGYFVPRVSRRYLSLQRNVSSGPHAIHIENREVRTTCTIERRLCGHVAGGPSGVCSQSTFIMSAPTSPADWNRRSMSSAPDDGPSFTTARDDPASFDLERIPETRQLEEACDGRAHTDQHEVRAALARRVPQRDEGPEPARVDERDIAEVDLEPSGRDGPGHLRAGIPKARRDGQVDLAGQDQVRRR